MTISATVSFDLLGQAQLDTTATTILTVPSDENWVAKDIVLSNPTSAAVTFSLYRVPSGGSAGLGNILWGTRTVPSYDSIQILGEKGLTAGVTVQGLCSVSNGITATISGVKFT